MKTLKELFHDELMDMYDAEHRILKALPKLAKAATCKQLQRALLHHLQETEGQVTKLEAVFQAIGEKPKSKKCQATVGLLAEGDDIVSENKGEPTINAAIISAAQKVEHYEIASYGTLHAWALKLDNQTAADLIEDILEQEKSADQSLSDLSDEKNDEALAENESDTDSASEKRQAARAMH